MQKLALSLKSIKDELTQWHEESKKNQTSIAALSKRLDMLGQKTTVSPEVQKELADMKATVQKMAIAPSAGSPEARAALEQHLNELQAEAQKIAELKQQLAQLSTTSDTADQRHEQELTALKEQVKAAPRPMAAEGMEGAEFMKTLKTELEAWHKESMENAKQLTTLLKRIGELEARTVVSDKVKKEMERTMNQVGQVADSIDKFQELKQTLLKHNEEFEDLYSTMGKEHVELSTLNESVTNLQEKLMEWSERNTENLEEVHDIRKDLAAVTKDLKEKDMANKIDEFGGTLGMLADRVESLQRQERELQEAQQKLIEFDRGMKELVRKAVIATLSKQDFEKELEKLEGGTPRPAAKPKAKPTAKKPTLKDVKSKMRELRSVLEEGKADTGLLEVFTKFEKQLTKATAEEQKKPLWDKLGTDVSNAMKTTLEPAKAKIEEGKAAGEDVSKLNILVAKADIGVVSLETSISMRNIVKAKEIVQKLADLKVQLKQAV